MTAQWLLKGFRDHSERSRATEDTENGVQALERMIDQDLDGVAVIAPQYSRFPEECWRRILDESDTARTALLLFVHWQPPPVLGLSADFDPVSSFYCPIELARSVVSEIRKQRGDISRACFSAVSHIASGAFAIESILARQFGIPYLTTPPLSLADTAVGLNMAHRGPKQYLAAALTSIKNISSPGVLNVRVALDTENILCYDELRESFGDVKFFQPQKTPAGPFVLRRALIEHSSEEWLLFHDSDDMSTKDRLTRLLSVFQDSAVGIAGSHEIRLDEINGRLLAVRYPIDASRALSCGRGHPQLHPSTLMRRDVYELSGGFSTHSMFGNDTQFLKRAYFHTSIVNLDEFLYVRRKHPEALTVRPDVGHTSHARLRLESTWHVDFEKVLRGQLNLAESSLRPIFDTAQNPLRLIH
jgi:hypothetical protein